MLGDDVRNVDTQPALNPSQESILGAHVVLKRLSLTDASGLFACMSGPGNESVWAYLKTGPFNDLESFRAGLQYHLDDPGRAFYTISDKTSSRPVGLLGLVSINTTHRTIEVGPIIFGASLQHTKAATEVLYLIARQLFEEWGYRRFVWECNSRNQASKRAAERYGFTYEGTFRQHFIIKGENRDTANYSMLDGEWDEVKKGFEAWLDDANFDAEGRQIKSLMGLRKPVM